MTKRLYRPPNWEDIKPQYDFEPFLKEVLKTNSFEGHTAAAIFDAGVEAGADAGILAWCDSVERSIFEPFREYYEAHGDPPPKAIARPEPTWAEVWQAFKAYPGKLMRIIRGTW